MSISKTPTVGGLWIFCSYCDKKFWVPETQMNKLHKNIPAYCSIECACYDGSFSVTKGYLPYDYNKV